jgi:regulation of enolase protein 1 (concanavalin A-like superfamily)
VLDADAVRLEAFLHQSFGPEAFDSRLVWSNAPPVATSSPHGLTIETAGDTDLWQRTHYGFRRDNVPALTVPVDFDFRLETRVRFEPVHQYDQAGLLVRLSPACWLKTSIEFEPHGASRLGSVVTNFAYSDWATQDVSSSVRDARFRITRHAGDYIVEHAGPSEAWSQLRIAHLHDDDGTRPIHAGLYACSPKERGFRATFEYLRLDRVLER